MNAKLDTETAQHLCGLVSRFFDHISEAAPEFGEGIDPRPGDFSRMCRDFTFDPSELSAAGEIDRAVVKMARAVLGLK